jgi:hypothetical protein
LMSKTERRNLIRSVYARACSGCVEAVAELAKLTKPRARYTKCSAALCSVPIRSRLVVGYCQMHDPSRLSMRKQLQSV